MGMPETLIRTRESNLKTYASINQFPPTVETIITQKRVTLIIKRANDIFFSAIGIMVLIPIFVLIGIMIKIDSPGPIFFKQTRIGTNGQPFEIYKFRKMCKDAKGIELTLLHDQRLTRIGSILREHKLDELPQLLNVLKGDMSIVGPRPEVPAFVKSYSPEQLMVLRVRPGITDYASVHFIDEGRLFEQVVDPEQYYVTTIMPQKISLNMQYIRDMSFITDMKIIFRTIMKLFWF